MLKEQRKTLDGVEVTKTYVECPYCKSQFNAYFDTQATLVLKKQIRKHMAKLQTIKDNHQYLKEEKAIEKKQRRLGRETNILFAKYNKEF